MTISIVNGPNLNLLGKRQPEIYGNESLDETFKKVAEAFPQIEFRNFQSNCEGSLIDIIQREGFDPEVKGIILNPGAYAHYSYAIADAISSIPAPVVEVHISNIHAREEFRQHSVTARSAQAVICGCGRNGYILAAQHIINL